MPSHGAVDRPLALEEFMAALRELRERTGAPSFRRMAAKSGAVSHATLHLAVTGYRLQPWETVREFVRACDGDEDAWYARWQETSRALSQDTEDEAGGGAPDGPEPGAPAPSGPPGPEGPRRSWWRGPRLLVPLAAVFVVSAGAGWVIGHPDRSGDGERGAGNADPHAMVYKGDASVLARETPPDGTKFKPGAQFVKVWEVHNTGGVEWRNRYLQRIDLPIRDGDCSTPERVPVNHTYPRQTVKITVPVRAPSKAPAECKVRWKMVDSSGRVLMPGYKPIYFDILVRG